MSHPSQTRRLSPRAALIGALAILLLLIGLVLYVPRGLPLRPQAHPGPATGRFALETRDANGQWDWQWVDDAPCLQGLADWAAPHGVQLLVLELTEPADHDPGLPIRSLYPDISPASAMAGAWCEMRVPGRSHTLVCALAPLTAGAPDRLTTALAGALGQAMAYALDPSVFAARQDQPWTWSQWQPLVMPGDRPGHWQSVCPALIPVHRRMP